MIVSFILYSVVVGAFVAAAAWLLERALGHLGRARRKIWIAAIVVALGVPTFVVLLQEPVRPQVLAPVNSAPAVRAQAGQIDGSLRAAPLLRTARIADQSLNGLAAGVWLLASVALVTFHALGAWRLSRRARRWPAMSLDSQPISVAPDLGPALFGWWRPRVVFPAWLLAAPETTQRLALAHERQHLAVRDPQVLATATLLIALLPWNLPLLWMLRRLRFAMEVDCDARVIGAGADPADYGLALLFVSERQSRSPLGTLALIERASQLERRIHIMVSSPRHRALVAGLCLALAGTCAFAATLIAPPERVDTMPLKPAPTGGPALRIGQSFERLLLSNYPSLLEGKFEGMPIVVALVNDDFSIAKSANTSNVAADFDPSLLDVKAFEAIGLTPAEIPYVGATFMQLPDKPGKRIIALYTEEPAGPGERFVSKLFPDSRTVDREIFEKHFPKSAIPAGKQPWVLLTREGRVLRSGEEAVDTKSFNAAIEARFPGVRTEGVTLTPLMATGGGPMYDLAGKELQLVSVWLAPGSPSPR